MTSVGIQADPNDPEGVLGIVRSFQAQLQDLAQISSSLAELNASRGQSIQQCEGLAEGLEGRIQELVESADHMETMLRENQHQQEDGDKELEDLTNRKEHLDSEIRRLQREAGENVPSEVDAELHLTGFAVEDLYRKMDSLSFLHQRLDRANQNLQQEWDEFKKDMRRDQSDMQPYLEAKDHLDELTLARYIGMQSGKDGQPECDLAERLCNHHENKKQQRQLQQQLMESEIKTRDLDNEISSLFAQKRDLWKRCLDLENFLAGLSAENDCERNLLRPSRAIADITEITEGRQLPQDEDSDDDLDDELEADHGRFLHRCRKNTNIAIGDDVSDVIDDEVNVAVHINTDKEQTRSDNIQQMQPKTDTIRHEEDTSDDITSAPLSAADLEDLITQEKDGVTGSTPDLTMKTQDKTRYVGGHHEQPASIMMKFRQRFGIRTSSSFKLKNADKKGLSVTGSLRGLGKETIFRRKR